MATSAGRCLGAETPVLPTSNRALLDGGGPLYYMHVVRKFQGKTSHPWEGGQYGFVRNPQVTKAGLVYSKFHEGMDIKPVRRDRAGEPIDEVRSIASGRVVYVSAPGSGSGYGNYIVIEHIWDGSPYYSLYAHLARMVVQAGQRVVRGEGIGIMGHTGPGLNRERAHLHFEVNLLLNSNFEAWHAAHYPTQNNRHGIYNGLNLAGIDVAAFYLALKSSPDVRPPDIVRRSAPFYRVRTPKQGQLEIAERYPWLLEGEGGSKGRSWEIEFDASGLPLRVKAVPERVEAPQLAWVKPSDVPYSYQTRGRIGGSGRSPSLTESGLRYLDLITR